jgi:outer membrane scaffolding protein for murein synthesis (MipA/OmpV family)
VEVPETEEAETLTFGTTPERTIIFSAFLGAQTNPAYFGSDEYVVGPSFRGGLGQLNFAGINFGSIAAANDPYARKQGFGYGLTFRYIGERDSGEYDEIEGLDDIDPTLEIGVAFGYATPSWEGIVDTRYGFGGSDAWVSELRLNYVARPTDRLTLRVGPRAFFGTANYMDTYFGINGDESARSGLAEYDPDGGLVSAGIEAVAAYRLNDRWWVEGGVRWDRYLDQAADSPIVEEGSDNSTVVRLGLRRTFTLSF